MPDKTIRIWHQSFTVLENLPTYAATLRAHLSKVARPNTEITLHGMHPDTFVTEYPGTDIRHSLLFRLHASQFVVNAVVAQEQGYDCYAICTIPDPALYELRSAINIPVVGYGESAMHLACLLGQRFGILVFIEEFVSLLEENVRRYGLASRLAEVRHVGFGFAEVSEAFAHPAPIIEKFHVAARQIIANGADVIIPGEAVLCAVLMSQGVSRVDDVPVVDALAATVKMAELMVDLRRVAGLRASRKGYFGAAPPRERIAELLRFYGLDRFTSRPQ